MMVRVKGAALLLLIFCPMVAEARARPRRSRSHRHTPPPEATFDANAVNDPATRPVVGPRSAGSAVLRAEILLARAHFSSGEIDGHYGSHMRGAIRSFQAFRRLPVDGVVREDTWAALVSDTAPALVTVAITPQDVAGPFTLVPEEMLEKAKLPALGYSSPLEAIAEKYHSSP